MHLNVREEDGFEKLYEHSWDENGYCRECDTQNTCTHEHCEDERWQWLNDCSYVYLDEMYHQIIGDYQRYTFCEDCGIFISLSIEEGHTELGQHNWSEGYCDLCHTQNTCTHRNYHIEGDNECEYAYLDLHSHMATERYIVYEICDNCGEKIVIIEEGDEYSGEEDHTWENGFCRYCGAKNTCQHNNGTWHRIGYNDSYWETLEYEYVNTTLHKRTGQAIEYDICVDCGAHFNETVIEHYEHYSSHNWENGVCNECGAENTCTHNHVATSWYWEDDQVEVEYVNEKCHKVSGWIIKYNICEDCRMDLGGRKKVYHEQLENHYWDENGRCGGCNSRNYCEHKNQRSVWYWEIWNPARSEYVDAKHHKSYGKITMYDYCEDCNDSFNFHVIDNYESLDEHWWVNGICEQCGASNTCQHDGEIIERYQGWGSQYGPLVTDNHNGTHHIQNCYGYSLVCSICNASLYNNDIFERFVEQDEEHDFYEGICCKCGASQEAAPTGVKAALSSKTASGRKTTISWSAVAGARYYNVYGGTGGVYTKLNTQPITGLSFTYTNPSYGKRYTYYVTVVTDKGESRYSAGVSTLALAKTALTVTPTSKGARLTWTKITGATGYKIMRSGKTIATIKSGSTVSYTDTKFRTPGKKCTYSIVPISTGNYSTTTVKKAYVHMASVTKVTLKNAKAKKLTISWAKAKGAVSYEVYYTTSKVKPTAATKAKKTTTGSSVTVSVTKGKTYYVYVRAVGKNGTTKTKGAWTAVKKLKITR